MIKPIICSETVNKNLLTAKIYWLEQSRFKDFTVKLAIKLVAI